MNSDHVGTVKVVQFDGAKPRVFTWKDEQCFPVNDDNGFPVYDLEKNHAKVLVTAHPQRYRLLGGPALNAQISSADGSNSWSKLNPWSYAKRTVSDGIDRENGEEKFKEIFEWREDVNATGRTILQDKQAQPEMVISKKTEEQLAFLMKRVGQLDDQAQASAAKNAELSENLVVADEVNSQLRKELSDLKAAQAPVVEETEVDGEEAAETPLTLDEAAKAAIKKLGKGQYDKVISDYRVEIRKPRGAFNQGEKVTLIGKLTEAME